MISHFDTRFPDGWTTCNLAKLSRGITCIRLRLNIFSASDGWIHSFLERIGFSSQAVSLHTGSHSHRKMSDHKEEVDEYKKKYFDFVEEHGKEMVVNFDETSFSCLTGKIRTIVQKNSPNQPRVKQQQKGRGLSIGCTITSDGQKLKSVLVTKGLTSRSLLKYKNYQNDNRCILTHNPMIPTYITKYDRYCSMGKYMNGKKCMCIWDCYRAHQTSEIIDQAKKLNIELLQVPKGMTPELQLLTTGLTVYKMKMNSHWIKNSYNENKKNYHLNYML